MREIKTTVMGNATADPSDRTREDGRPSALVRIAVTPSFYNSSTEDYTDRKTEFISVYAYGRLAQNLLKSVRKGQPLIVTGRLNSSEWIGEDGTTRHTLNVQAEAIGHDLSFGTAAFLRPMKLSEAPDLDPRTDAILSSTPAVNEDGEVTGEEETEESLAPAF